MPLSPVQKQVAALLAQGCSNEKIGQHLHIKLTTVKDHIRKIFTKLDINHREELLPKLLAMECSSIILGGNGHPFRM
jgi:ATP/maltotriose-dependent transcriptional regulator MalT